MSRDLLADLQHEAGIAPDADNSAPAPHSSQQPPTNGTSTTNAYSTSGGEASLSSADSGDSGDGITDKELAAHMARYDDIKKQLEIISQNTETVKEITRKLKTTANESVRQQIISEKDSAITSTTQQARAIKTALDSIKTENEQIIANDPEQRNTAKMDMRVNLYNTYLRKFDHVITDSNSAIIGFKSVLEQIEKRQLKNVLPDMTDDQVQEIIDQGRSSEIVQQVLVSDNLNETVRMIEQRHDEILKLERQVREIFELFNDLATLVNLQQESLDVISVNVANANRKVIAAQEEIEVAADYQKKVRNRKVCCCLLVILIILCAVLIPSLISALVRRD